MFLAASTRCFSDLPVFEACERLTDLEYSKVELWMDEEGDHLKASTAAEDPEKFAATYRESTRLTPLAFCLERDTTPEIFTGLAQLAKLLRVAQITVPASPLGTPFNTEVDRLREFVAIGTKDGIRVSIQTHGEQLSQDPRTAVELCQAVKGLGITLDPSHYVCSPIKVSDYDVVFPHVYHVHLRDTSPTELQVPVGLGEIDYARIISLLEREDYNRAFSVVLFQNDEDFETHMLEMRKIRRLLETLL